MAQFGVKICRQFCSKAGDNCKAVDKVLLNAVGGRGLVESMHVLKGGRIIAAWHPDPAYPYELSQPLPAVSVEQNPSLLKEEVLRTAMSAFSNRRPEVAREELTRLTYTCKNRWFPRSRDKKAKKTPMDRPYL